jgi:hypothetical protein
MWRGAGPSGGGWSFKGNGALAVYPALPGVVVGGLTALVLHARGGRRWLAAGVGARLAGLLIALLGAVVLPVFGSGADQVGSPVALLALVLWIRRR